jgi:hypothetical protein
LLWKTTIHVVKKYVFPFYEANKKLFIFCGFCSVRYDNNMLASSEQDES